MYEEQDIERDLHRESSQLHHDDDAEAALHSEQRGRQAGERLAGQRERPDAHEPRESCVAEDDVGERRGSEECPDADDCVPAADHQGTRGDDGVPLGLRLRLVVVSEDAAEEAGPGHHREEVEAHLDELDRTVLRW